jgi:hypothetical protein
MCILWLSAPDLDLSFNPAIGPTVPASLQTATVYSLTLMGCGLTDVQPNAFAGANIYFLDLSLNNFRSGIHRGSFHNFNNGQWAGVNSLALSNCNLRSESLVPGMLDTGVSSLWNMPRGQLFIDNMDPAVVLANQLRIAGSNGPGWAPNRLHYAARLFTANTLNPPTQPSSHSCTIRVQLEQPV